MRIAYVSKPVSSRAVYEDIPSVTS